MSMQSEKISNWIKTIIWFPFQVTIDMTSFIVDTFIWFPLSKMHELLAWCARPFAQTSQSKENKQNVVPKTPPGKSPNPVGYPLSENPTPSPPSTTYNHGELPADGVSSTDTPDQESEQAGDINQIDTDRLQFEDDKHERANIFKALNDIAVTLIGNPDDKSDDKFNKIRDSISNLADSHRVIEIGTTYNANDLIKHLQSIGYELSREGQLATPYTFQINSRDNEYDISILSEYKTKITIQRDNIRDVMIDSEKMEPVTGTTSRAVIYPKPNLSTLTKNNDKTGTLTIGDNTEIHKWQHLFYNVLKSCHNALGSDLVPHARFREQSTNLKYFQYVKYISASMHAAIVYSSVITDFADDATDDKLSISENIAWGFQNEFGMIKDMVCRNFNSAESENYYDKAITYAHKDILRSTETHLTFTKVIYESLYQIAQRGDNNTIKANSLYRSLITLAPFFSTTDTTDDKFVADNIVDEYLYKLYLCLAYSDTGDYSRNMMRKIYEESDHRIYLNPTLISKYSTAVDGRAIAEYFATTNGALFYDDYSHEQIENEIMSCLEGSNARAKLLDNFDLLDAESTSGAERLSDTQMDLLNKIHDKTNEHMNHGNSPDKKLKPQATSRFIMNGNDVKIDIDTNTNRLSFDGKQIEFSTDAYSYAAELAMVNLLNIDEPSQELMQELMQEHVAKILYSTTQSYSHSINNTSYTLKPEIVGSESSSAMLYRLTVIGDSQETTQDLSSDEVHTFLLDPNAFIEAYVIQEHNEQIQRLDSSTPGQSPGQDSMFDGKDTHADHIPAASTDSTESTVASSVTPRNR